MSIQPIPLRDRLQAVSNHIPAHPEYIPAVLRAFADQPITAYLSAYPDALERLAELVRYPAQHMSELTYRDVAVRIQDMRRSSTPAAKEAAALLARPLAELYHEREEPPHE